MRKICLVTSTRADYGLLKGCIDLLSKDSRVDFRLVVTGMHLKSEYGNTVEQIKADGYAIDCEIDILESSTDEVAVSNGIANAVKGFATYFNKNKPDILMVLGDRFEILGVTTAATISKIPVAHIHGGESTFGLIDEPIRHSLTKMAHLHFCATEVYKHRIIQLGEDPSRVFNFGAPGVDLIKAIHLMEKEELFEEIKFPAKEKNILVTYHPVTLSGENPELAIDKLLSAVDGGEFGVIFTMPNADTNSEIIKQKIIEFCQKYPDRCRAYDSLGQLRYLSAVKHVDVVLGNSSSGLIEVPYLGTATVNIGDRQKGRVSGSSVIHCTEETTSIKDAIKKAMSLSVNKSEALYGSGEASKKIVETVVSYDLKDVLFKEFYDMR